MKRTVLGFALAIAMLLPLAACGSGGGQSGASTPPQGVGGTPPPAQTAAPGAAADSGLDISTVDTSDWVKLDLSYATYLPAENPNVNLCYTSWQQKLDELMPGWVNITIYPSGTLLAQPDIFEGVKSGVADIGMVDVGGVKELLPLSALITLPTVPVGSTAAASMAFQEWYEMTRPSEFNDVVVLHMQSNATGQIITNFQWDTRKDLAGKQVRATSALADTVAAIGATPVSIDTSEIYEASRSGLIDGAYYSINATYLCGAHEFLKYASFTYMGGSPYAYVMNKDMFNSMPATQQAFFMEAIKQAFYELIIPQIPIIMDVHEPALRAIEAGQIIPRSLSEEVTEDLRVACEPIEEAYLTKLESKGYDTAREDLDLLKQLVEKWNGWYTISDYERPFYMAAEGQLDEFMAELAGYEVPPYLDIVNYVPLSERN